MAIDWCLSELQPYIGDPDITVETDHKPLENFHKKQISNRRAMNWIFNYKTSYHNFLQSNIVRVPIIQLLIISPDIFLHLNPLMPIRLSPNKRIMTGHQVLKVGQMIYSNNSMNELFNYFLQYLQSLAMILLI